MSKTEDLNSWCMRTSARLRSVHASFSDDQLDRRSGFVEDELEFALEEGEAIAGENRESLLKALELMFPSFGEVVPDHPDTEKAGPQSKATIETASIDSLLASLTERSSELSPAHRATLASLSGEAVKPSTSADLPAKMAQMLSIPREPEEVDDCVKAIQQLWKLTGGNGSGDQVLRMSRMVKMLGILTGAFKDLHLFAWSFWREIAPREIAGLLSPGSTGGIEALIADYVSGGQTSSGDFFKDVEKTKRVIIGLLHSTHRSGLDYGKFLERKYSPDAVTDAVALEESATDIERIRDLGRKCWERYSKLSRNRTAEAMHDEFLRIFAENVHAYIKKQA
jgi:hypothetical protein